MGLIPVDSKFSSSFVAQEHIFTDRHIGDQRKFLMNDDDALLFTVFQGMKTAFLTVVKNISRIASVGIPAAQHVHQRGFPRTVFSNQCMDAASLNDEIYVVKSFDTGEFLGDPSHFQYNVRQIIPSKSERLLAFCFRASCRPMRWKSYLRHIDRLCSQHSTEYNIVILQISA